MTISLKDKSRQHLTIYLSTLIRILHSFLGHVINKLEYHFLSNYLFLILLWPIFAPPTIIHSLQNLN